MAYRSRRGLAALVVVIAAGAVSTGCAAATPICDAAAPLLARGQVASAAELYGRAAQSGEGSCADDGMSRAGQAFSQAYSEVAAGTDAELSGDVPGATEHYEAALRIDGDNQAAVQGLTRLKRAPVRIETPVTVTPAPSTTTSWGWPDLLTLIGFLLAAGLGIAATLRFRSRLAGLETKIVDPARREARGGPAGEEPSGQAAAAAGLARERKHLVDLLGIEVDGLRGNLEELRATIERLPLDQLRTLLVWSRDHVPAGPRRPEDAQPTLAWWVDLSNGRAVGSRQRGQAPRAVLTLLVTVMDVDEGLLDVHVFRVEAESLDLGGVLGDETVMSAVEVLSLSPEEDDAVAALRTSLGGVAVDRQGRRTVAAPVADPRMLSHRERAFWRSLGGAVILTLSQHREGGQCVDVFSYLRPDAMATFLDTPELTGTLIDLTRGSSEDAARDDLDSLVTSALEDHLLQQIGGRGAVLPRFPLDSVLRVDALGRAELVALENTGEERSEPN